MKLMFIFTPSVRYNDALWKAFGAKLEDNLCYEMYWSKPGGHKSNIGSVDLCTPGAVDVFTSSILAAASKGLYTN